MSQRDTLSVVVEEVAQALAPLQAAVSSPEEFVVLMAQLGWSAEDIPQPLQDLAGGLSRLLLQLQRVVEREETSQGVSLTEINELRGAVQDVFGAIEAIRSAPDAAFPPSLLADDFKSEFPSQLVQFLLVKHLTSRHPRVAYVLRALGVVRIDFQPPQGNRPGYVRYLFELSGLPEVLEDPALVFRNAFGWGTDEPDFEALFRHLENFLISHRVDVTRPLLPEETTSALAGRAPEPDEPLKQPVAAVFFERVQEESLLSAELLFTDLPADGALKPGLALLPRFNGALDSRTQLSENVSVTINSGFDLQGGVGLILRPGRDPDVLLGFDDEGGAPTSAQGSINVRVEVSAENQEPIVLLGSAEAGRLEFKNASITGGLALDAKNNTQDLFVEFELQGGKVVIEPGQGDGFLQRILPSRGISADFGLVVGLSVAHGFYFTGSGGLEVSLPAHASLGPLTLEALTVGAQPSGGALPFTLGATLQARLGPLTAVVDNMGLRATFTFPGGGGNVGPLDVALGFKPPAGVGLVVDAGVVKGGGYLAFDSAKGEYAGALELVFSNFLTLKAIGFITTRTPDGKKGFSLLVIITAEFGTGIQLGFGFTLLGVGGLLGLNRTVALDPLVQGVRTGATNNILFPTNVIANAPRILSDLRTFFPQREGKFLIGPMAKFAWGTPPLITATVGLIIEIPGNVVIVGRVRAALPTEEAALLVLQVSFVGAFEFDKRRVWFFASLFESRVLTIPIEGEMGLLVDYGDAANSLVSVGGFHPRFSPPPMPFPTPARVAISLVNEPNARVRAEGYFAITSNTVQFGARLDAFFGFGSFNITGYFGFDVIFRPASLSFVTEISAGFSVKIFGLGVFGIHLRATFEGATPFRLRGSASIGFFFFTFSVNVNATFGLRLSGAGQPLIALLTRLREEFERPESWRATLPPAGQLFVSLRQLADPDELALHPVGTLQISQRFAPLNLPLDRVGGQKPSDVKLVRASVQTATLEVRGPTREKFAPAQFRDMDDAAKLSAPAFEPLDSGVEVGASGPPWATGPLALRVVRYETIILDKALEPRRTRFFDFFNGLFAHFRGGASVARASASLANERRLQPFAGKVEFAEERFTVASQADNREFEPAATFGSRAEALAHLERAVRLDPNLAEAIHVIPSAEVNKAA